MKWYGKEIYCTRGETFSLDCSIVDDNGLPFRISTELKNAFLVLTVSSTKYHQDKRYVLRNWINLADFPKVEDMTILPVDALPTGNNLIRNRVLLYDGKYYIYSDVELKYVEYGFRVIHTFRSETTKDWIDKTYEYDLRLVSGDLDSDYVSALSNGNAYDGPPLANKYFEMELIPKTKMYVEDLNGGDYIG